MLLNLVVLLLQPTHLQVPSIILGISNLEKLLELGIGIVVGCKLSIPKKTQFAKQALILLRVSAKR